jgi:hypothetical protein
MVDFSELKTKSRIITMITIIDPLPSSPPPPPPPSSTTTSSSSSLSSSC